MKLKDAALCLDCDELFDLYEGLACSTKACPVCANTTYLRVNKIIEEKAEITDGINLGTLSSSIDFNSMGKSTIIIGAIKKTFKIKRRYLRVNYYNNTLEESGPIDDEVDYSQGWFTCEET